MFNRFAKVIILAAVAGACLMTGCARPVETFRKQGVKLYKDQQFDPAMSAFEKALKDDQFDAVSNAYEGLIYYRTGQYEQAEYHFRVALNADPSNDEAKGGLTITLIKKGKPDEALDALERAAKMAEGVDDPRWMKSDAKKVYTKQTEEHLFLGKVNDRVRIARAYQVLGDYDNALIYYKKALDISPENVNVMMSIADLGEKAGNKPLTLEYLRMSYLKAPGTPGLTDAMTRNGLAISDVTGPR